MNNLEYENEENNSNKDEATKTSDSAIGCSVFVMIVGIVFSFAGFVPMLFLNEKFNIGILVYELFAFPVFLLGLWHTIGGIRYQKHPWKLEKAYLVKKVIPFTEENRDELYRLYDVDSDEHHESTALWIEELIKSSVDVQQYAVRFENKGKINRSNIDVEKLKRKVMAINEIDSRYVTTDDRFREGQLYAIDTKKYSYNFYISDFSADDFEWLG